MYGPVHLTWWEHHQAALASHEKQSHKKILHLTEAFRHTDRVEVLYLWPLVASYGMPGIQWTYSISGPSSPQTACLGYSGPTLSPALSRLIRHAWDTVDLLYLRPLVASYGMPGIQWTYSISGPSSPHTACLGYSGPTLSPALSHLIRHAWDTVDLLYLRPLVASYGMPGIQWTYSISGP